MKTLNLIWKLGLFIFLCNLSVYSAVIQGKLVDIQGKPLADLTIKSEAKDIEPIKMKSGSDGAFKFENLAANIWKLTVEEKDWESINLEIKILGDKDELTYNLIAWPRPQIPNEVISAYKDIIDYVNDNKLEEAMTEIDKLIQAGHNYFIIYVMKGRILVTQQKIAEAIPFLKKALELNPYDFASNQVIANQSVDNKQFKESIPYYQRMLISTPTNPDVLEELANSYYVTDDFQNAIKNYKEAIKYYGTSANAAQSNYYLGASLIKIKEYEQALKCFEKFLELSPNSIDAPKTRQLVDALKKKIESDKQKNANTPK